MPKKSNAILMVTAISGNHHRLDFMIGPGKALDTDKYFIIATDAISNGFTTSPSNSTAQPRMQFPKFLIRDMVTSQHRLLTEHLGINHVVAVVGPSMGGMQVLQWGVSHPDFMDSLVSLVPLAKTPAWTVAVLESSRKAIMLDPAWNQGNYASPPEQGIRLWRDILLLAARSPEGYRAQFKNPLDVIPWMQQQETNLIKAFDANDWIYQTWAYERHDVGTTPGMNGDTEKALQSIKAKTLILLGIKDLLNPEWEPADAARSIRDAKVMTISPGSVTGHAAAGGAIPADVEFINRESGGLPRPCDRGRQAAGLSTAVIPGLVPGIQPSASAGACWIVDPGNECRDDTFTYGSRACRRRGRLPSRPRSAWGARGRCGRGPRPTRRTP